MAKVKLSPMFESASGSLCSKNGTYIALNRQTGKMYQAEYHERPYPNTSKQQEVKATFASRAKAASAWWAQNKPSEQNPDGTADYQKLIKQYKAQRKIGNPYSYLRSLVQDDLTIQLGGSTTVPSVSPEGDNNQGGTTTPPSLD